MKEAHHYEARVIWTGAAMGGTVGYESYSREWRLEMKGKAPLAGSADPAFRGDPALANPEDLLLAALSACHLLSYLAICARARIEIVSYEDEASGTMSFLDGKYRFTDVLLRPRVVVRDPSQIERALRFHAEAHRECYIASSVNFPVRHEPEARAA